MPTLRPLRDYDEHDVINLFSWSGSVPAYKGTLVKGVAGGWKATDDVTEMFGNAGDKSFDNTVSQRYRTSAQVAACGVSDQPIGILLYDVRDTDENGEKLIYHPQRAAENDFVISGQAAPILTRGVVLYSGATLAAQTPVPGTKLYTAANGEITTGSAGNLVGKALGSKDSNSHVLVKLEL